MKLKDNLKMAAAVVAVVGGLAALVGWPHLSRDTYRAKVTDKERVVDGDSNRYLVFTELEDGRTRVFENTDSTLEWKFNSSDLQGKLQEGKTYDIDTYGVRAPFFSWYENIIGVREVQ